MRNVFAAGILAGFCLASTMAFAPSAFALSESDKAQIAERLGKAFPQISVTLEGRPIIAGDRDPVVFRISPSGKPTYGQLFLRERYDIIAKPSGADGIGVHMCYLADEFVRERRKQQADFLPKFELSLSPKVRGVELFEIRADQDTLKGVAVAVIQLYDFLRNDYGHFDILVRGYADRGRDFRRPILPDAPIRDLTFLPLEDPQDRLMAIYARRDMRKPAPDPYSNADLPNLRATFFKRAIDRFLTACRTSAPIPTQSHVLDGAVIDETAPDYRTIDVYFYAYR